MVNKYARILEEQAINTKTGEIWTLNDVPAIWRTKTESKVIEDGYTFDEAGHAIPPLKEEEEPADEAVAESEEA